MARRTIYPKAYKPHLTQRQTEVAIRDIKEFFETNLSTELNLSRVTAPLFVQQGTGINDDLNGIEKPVSFHARDLGVQLEVVQSLAKWKRLMLGQLGFEPGFGLYTDMNAIRPDEDLDNTHSLYVDQWDWEKVIKPEDRSLATLKKTVEKIFYVLKRMEFYIYERHPEIKPILPEEITFIHAQELLDLYPGKTDKEREDAICKKHGAVFVIGIGAPLSDGKPHDGRAPDYDDWITRNEAGFNGLNGDILVWHPVLETAFELSSMGIRVSPESLQQQLEIRGCTERAKLYFHNRLLNKELPQTLGGGIGQSRLCMYFLRKAHIGEVQANVWPEDIKADCSKHNIPLL